MIVGAAAAASLPLGLIYRSEIAGFVRADLMGKPSLFDARKNPNYRQRFLDNLVAGIDIPYCDGVVYDHHGDKISGFYNRELMDAGYKKRDIANIIGQDLRSLGKGDYDLKTPDVFNAAGKSRHTKIFVGRKTFEDKDLFADSEEIKSGILHHESRHVEQYALWMDYLPSPEDIINELDKNKMNPKLLYEICEYDATAYELQRILTGKFSLSSEFIKRRKREFVQEGLKLTSYYLHASEFEKDIIFRTHEAIAKGFPELRDISIK